MISERGTNLAVAAAAARAASEAPPQEGAAAPLEMKAASATFSKHSLERKRRREGGKSAKLSFLLQNVVSLESQ